MKHYVLGFAFDNSGHVLLIKKTKPEWQKGLLNGIGGKIEEFDLAPVNAMVREFKEECDIDTTEEDWKYVGVMTDEINFAVFIFRALDIDLRYAKATTEEEVSLTYADAAKHYKTISNVPWLIEMCRDADVDAGKSFKIIYRN